MRGSIALLWLLAASVVSQAADPTAKPIVNPVEASPAITGEKTGEWMVDLKVKNVPTGTAIIWDVYPQDTIRRVGTKRIIKVEQGLVFAGPKGKYDVLVRLVKGDDVQEVTGVIEITGGVAPAPPIDPVVDPARKDVSYRVVFVEETSAAAGERGAFLTNKALDAHLKAKGHGLRIVDKDVVDKNGKQPADLVDILKDAAAKAYPQVFLVDKAGKLKTLGFDATGLTPEALVKLLTSNGG